MQLNHVGIINKDEEQVLKFYVDFLGLEKTREILLPLELSEQLFSVAKEIKVLVVENAKAVEPIEELPQVIRGGFSVDLGLFTFVGSQLAKQSADQVGHLLLAFLLENSFNYRNLVNMFWKLRYTEI